MISMLNGDKKIEPAQMKTYLSHSSIAFDAAQATLDLFAADPIAIPEGHAWSKQLGVIKQLLVVDLAKRTDVLNASVSVHTALTEMSPRDFELVSGAKVPQEHARSQGLAAIFIKLYYQAFSFHQILKPAVDKLSAWFKTTNFRTSTHIDVEAYLTIIANAANTLQLLVTSKA